MVIRKNLTAGKYADGRGLRLVKRKQYNKRLTLEEVVAGCFKARQDELKDEWHWLCPLELHVLPKIGKQAAKILTSMLSSTP